MLVDEDQIAGRGFFALVVRFLVIDAKSGIEVSKIFVDKLS